MADDLSTVQEGNSGNVPPVTTPDLPSVYSVSSADNPGAIITHVVLKGENYADWAKAVRTALSSEKKLALVDGRIKKPESGDVHEEDWYVVISMIVGWIFNTIDPTLPSSLSYMDIAQRLWEALAERFSIGNDIRLHQLKYDIMNCKQSGQSVTAYYGKLKSMWEEMAGYTTNPVCSCNGCTCGAATELVHERDKEKTHQFLLGLDDGWFGTTRSNILSMSPLPNVNRAYALILIEERHQSMSNTKSERSDGFAFSAPSSGPIPRNISKEPPRTKTTTCTYCGKSGHEISQCFELVGYPEWWERSKGSGRGKGKSTSKSHERANLTITSPTTYRSQRKQWDELKFSF